MKTKQYKTNEQPNEHNYENKHTNTTQQKHETMNT